MSKCVKKISDHTCLHFFPCGKTAKFRVWYADGPVVPMCGTHANQAKRRGGNVLPLGKRESNNG